MAKRHEKHTKSKSGDRAATRATSDAPAAAVESKAPPPPPVEKVVEKAPAPVAPPEPKVADKRAKVDGARAEASALELSQKILAARDLAVSSCEQVLEVWRSALSTFEHARLYTEAVLETELKTRLSEVSQKEGMLDTFFRNLEEREEALRIQLDEIMRRQEELSTFERELSAREKALVPSMQAVAELESTVSAAQRVLEQREAALILSLQQVGVRETGISAKEEEVARQRLELEQLGDALMKREMALATAEALIAQRETSFTATEAALAAREAALAMAERGLADRENAVAAAERLLREREAAVVGAESAKRVDPAEAAAQAAKEAELERREQSMRTLEKMLSDKQQALDDSDKKLSERQRAVDEAEKSFASKQSELQATADKLKDKENSLRQQEEHLERLSEEIAIREAAAEEAMSLAETMGGEPSEAPAETPAPARVSPPPNGVGTHAAVEKPALKVEPKEVIEGPPTEDLFLEGPDMSFEGPAMPVPTPAKAAAATVARAVVDDNCTIPHENRIIEDKKKLRDEAGQLLALVKKVTTLALLEPRIERALSSTSFNYTVLVAFYNLALQLLSEELANKSKGGGKTEEMEKALQEKDKIITEKNGLITSLKEDFDRYRKRAKTEQEAFVGRANEELLHRLVPVADNFMRCLAAAENATNVSAILDGVRMIHRQFEDVLSREGLVPIRAKGEPFDPKLHEALDRIITTEVPDDTIYEEIQRGYTLGGKVFRPAMVKVAKAPV